MLRPYIFYQGMLRFHRSANPLESRDGSVEREKLFPAFGHMLVCTTSPSVAGNISPLM
jgi:hypothetical protein